jgi:hypothetical protein
MTVQAPKRNVKIAKIPPTPCLAILDGVATRIIKSGEREYEVYDFKINLEWPIPEVLTGTLWVIYQTDGAVRDKLKFGSLTFGPVTKESLLVHQFYYKPFFDIKGSGNHLEITTNDVHALIPYKFEEK